MSNLGKVIVNFLGVCTYIRRSAFPMYAPESIAGHRWVLVNASNPATIADNPHLNQRQPPIDPHDAKLQIMGWQVVSIDGPAPFVPTGDTLVLPLDGYVLSIENESLTAGIDDANLACMPSLAMLAPGLGPVGDAVLTFNPQLTACFFDFQSGKLEGTVLRQDGAGASMLTIPTANPTDDPILKLMPFAPGIAPTFIRLHNDRTELPPGINVMNLPFGEGKVDDASDFFLHYLTAATFPPDATSQRAALTCPISPFTFGFPPNFVDSAGPECSNSGYP